MRVVLAACLVGCGAGEMPVGGSGGAGGAIVPRPPPIELALGTFSAMPATEGAVCVTLRLGNDASVFVDSLRTSASEGAVQVVAYKVTDAIEQTEATPCIPFDGVFNGVDTVPLAIGRGSSDNRRLPQGVAFRLPADQMMRLEVRYANPGSGVLAIDATMTLGLLAAEAVEQEAGVLSIRESGFEIPSGMGSVSGPRFFGPPASLDGARYFSTIGHQRSLGTGILVQRVQSVSGAGISIYDPASFEGQRPPTVDHSPPFTLPAQGGFRLRCEWTNDTGSDVALGPAPTDEACLFWAYYYPAQGPIACTNNVDGSTFCCEGTICMAPDT